MSFVGNLSQLSPEAWAFIESAAPNRKPDEPRKEGMGVDPVTAFIAYEMLSQSSDAASDTSSDFSTAGND